MTWSGVRDALKSALVSATGLVPAAVIWKRSAEPFAKSLILVDIITSQQEGPDRVIPEYNVGADKFDVEASSAVQFTASIRCESALSDTLDLAEKVRSGLALPSVKAGLAAAGVVVVGFPGSVVPVDNLVIDDRSANAHVIDVQFRAEFHRADPVQITTIEHVQTSGDLVTPSGSVLSVAKTVNR